MWEYLTEMNTLTVFLCIGAAGFLTVLASFLFGEIIDAADFDGDFDADAGADGPGLFNMRVLAVVLTAFGGFGAIATLRGFGAMASALIGLGGGVAMGWVIYRLLRVFYQQQASSLVTDDDLIGAEARVTVAIPENGFGQVRAVIGETAIEKIARSQDGVALAEHDAVLIEAVEGGNVVVSPLRRAGEARGLFSQADRVSESH